MTKSITNDNIKLPLYKSYMDDVNIVVDIIAKKDAKLDDLELQTAKHLQQLANNIFPGMFNVTVDYPSNNPDNKMPLLDLKCWIDPDTNKILHCFYRKPVYRQGVIRYDSGLPYQMKRTILLIMACIDCQIGLETKGQVAIRTRHS